MTFVHVPDGWVVPQRTQGAHTADTEDLLLAQAMLGISPVKQSKTERMGLPVNLFDAMRVVLRKPAP